MLCYQLLKDPVKGTLSLEVLSSWLSTPEDGVSWFNCCDVINLHPQALSGPTKGTRLPSPLLSVTPPRQRAHLVDVADDAVLEFVVPLWCVVVGQQVGGVEEHDKTPILSRAWK